MKKWWLIVAYLMLVAPLAAQNFYRGNDLSYVNQMEDCGAVYKQNGEPKEVYQIYADHGNNLVRVRLWVNPSWQNELSQPPGVLHQYSDLEDVKETMKRSKAAGMPVLLDFHYSDFWADPARQVVPNQWREIATNTDSLASKVYNYTFDVLKELYAEELLPYMVQIGNETNSGMLLYQSMSEDFEPQGFIEGGWSRQETLFNAGINAVREFSDSVDADIKIALHYAGVGSGLTNWYNTVTSNGITDFDVIGFSYYYAWHGSSIEAVGQQIAELRATYPDKEIVILETGYPWTEKNFDSNPNIITAVTEAYSPPSPTVQLDYLVDLTRTVKENGGNGVIFWESAWVSTPCRTPWAQGSSHDHVAFFEYGTNNFISIGGGLFMKPEIYENMDSQMGVFGVDMGDIEVTGGVYIETDLGKGESSQRYQMYNEGDNRYTFVEYLAPESTIRFKFVAVTNMGELTETLPMECNTNDMRTGVMGHQTTLFGYHWASCDRIAEGSNPTEVTVTFAVDMTGHNQANGVYITGDFTSEGNWEIIKMKSEGNNIYSYSQKVPVNTEGGWYFLDGENWSDRETVPSECVGYYNSDRGYFIGEEDVTYAYKFGSCETFNYVPVSNEEEGEVPFQSVLYQNYPNPFNPKTEIMYQLEKSGFVELSVYNLLGQKVQTLESGFRTAGMHKVSFDAKGLPSGTYLYKLTTEHFSENKKLMLIK